MIPGQAPGRDAHAGSGLDLRVPPAVVAAAGLTLQWWLTRGRRRVTPVGALASASLAAAGVRIGLGGIREFRRAETTIHPQHPEETSALVGQGVYRFTRNPMYLAMGLGLLGVAALTGRAVALLPVPGYVAWLDRFQIRPEERALSARFGRAYDDYRSRVRRWL